MKILPSCCRVLRAVLLTTCLALLGVTAKAATAASLSILCPTNVTLWTCGNNTIYQYPQPLVTGGCPPYTVACTPPSGTAFPVGVSVVTCTVTDGCTNRDTCTFTVTVRVDTEPPVIQCPTNIVQQTCPSPTGGCGAIVVYPPPFAFDNSGFVSVSCAPPSGSFFPCGVTTVTCRAIDRCERQAFCQFTVTVNPSTLPPTIQCPPDRTITTCSNFAVANYPLPAVNPPGTTVICNPPPGTPLPLGPNVISCVASNPCGRDECKFTITVRPVPPPDIQCPTVNIVVTAPCASNCVPVFYPSPTVFNGTLAGCNPPSGACLPVGVHNVTCLVTNECGARAQCSFTVQVNQGQGAPPDIRCPPDMTVATCSNCVSVAYPAPVVVNGVLIGCTPKPSACLPLGVNIITCSASNDCGRSECSFKIEVRPVPPPSIQCPANVFVVTAPCTSNCVPVFYPLPPVINGDLVGCNPPSGACLPPGLHPITCLATNRCGDRDLCTFNVLVNQGTGLPPTINCPQDFTVLTCSNCVPVSYPTPTVFNGVLIGCTPPPGTCLPLGPNVITCVASNPCGRDECKFTITVRPTPPPSIQCPTNVFVATVPCGSNCVPVFYPLPPVLNGVLVGCNPPSGACLPPGLHPITCLATNRCGDRDLCTFNVLVNQGTGLPPTINCPQDFTVLTCSNCVPVSYPMPTVFNGVLIGCTPPPGTCLPLGPNVITCVASNPCGRDECKFTITVRPTPPPSILCPDDITVATCKNCEVVNYPPPLVNNGILLGCNPPSGTCLPPGNHVVTCVASNACGRSECRFTVTVRPLPTCVKPPLSMVLWLPFDEPAGVIAHNIIPGSPNGTHIGGPVPLLGQHVLNSLSFNGVNQWVSVPPYAAIGLSASDLSIDAWVLRQDDGGRRAIVSKVHPTPAGVRGYEFYLLNGIMRLGLWGVVQQQFDSGTVVPLDNTWHHLAVTVSRLGSGNVRFYLDGVGVASLPGPIPAPLGNSGRLAVGRSTTPLVGSPASHFRGAIDEVEIFRRVLTPAEVHSLWFADRSGKCKIRCSIPWDVSFPPGQPCITVQARICNDTAVPQTISWSAEGPMPFPTPSGTLELPPFACTNVPIRICRPTNGMPVGAVVRWELTVQPEDRCPIVCMGSVINPGPIIIRVPDLPLGIPGTSRPGLLRFAIDGLPPGQPLVLRVVGPEMEPDLTTVSLNGLPPGTALVFEPNLMFSPAAEDIHDVQVQFVEADPVGTYTILIQADVNGDEALDTIASADVENPVVSPPTLSIVPRGTRYAVLWEDEGDGLGSLETSKEVDGPWDAIPDAAPGYLFDPTGEKQFFRLLVP